jgi:molecular chaperone GrpE
VGDALKSLLPIMDSMELALRSPVPDPEEFRRGVDLIRQQIENALQNLGVRRIAAKGEPFDPYLHEAIEVVDTTAAGDGEVLEEVRPGYRLGERLLRPAMVLVARNRAA